MRSGKIPLLWSIACAVALALASSGVADEVALDKPLKVSISRKDRTPLAGMLVAYDENRFRIKAPNGAVTEVTWDELDARNIFLLHKRAFGDTATAEQWFELGERLSGDADSKWSDLAFEAALKLDASLVDRIKEAKTARKQAAPPQPAAAKAKDDADADPTAAEDKFWGRLTEEQSEAAIAELKAFAEEARKTIGMRELRAYESKYFLFCTDLDAKEAAQWYGLLDKMYDRLLAMFAIPKATNIWHGKALVFVFKDRSDFVSYEATVEEYQAAPSVAGLCHQVGPIVRIAFYRQPDEMEFAQVLVHESSHGFIHRYRSPEHIPSWVNEGLAEWIAYDLVPRSKPESYRIDAMKQRLNDRGDTGGMFEAGKIEPWQYDLAYTLTDFMIRQNRRGYIKFFNALKGGKAWDKALEEDYGAPVERLVAAYGQSLRLNTILKP